MGEARRKAESVVISVLIPERGRPAMLHRLIQSLIETAGGDRHYEILVSIDDDDLAWVDQPPRTSWSPEHPVLWFHGPRPVTLGEKINELARQAQGQILWFIANDYVMETPGWCAKFREAVAKLPNGIGYPFVHDDLHPDHAAFPLITRKMIDAIGFMFPPWFPYWYTDTWADQCGVLLGVRPEIAVTVRAPEGRGKSHGLKDVTFWATFFREMLPFRSRDAMGLAKLAYGENSAGFADVRARLADREALCDARTRHLITPEFADIWEARSESPPGPGYDKVKKYAEGMLTNLRAAKPREVSVGICVPSGRTVEAASANAIAAMSAYSAMAGVRIMNLNTQASSIAHNRNQVVEIALKTGLDFTLMVDSDMVFPPDTLMKLLAHDLDVCGALYCKRSFPHDIIGKLAGPKPDEMTDGLYPALYMPGGMLLVRNSVFRKLGYPCFAEAYQFQGVDGLEAFKNMARCYFSEVPPDDALESLDGTSFGEWIKVNNSTGFNGEKWPYLSEDNFFIQRCRRAGYTPMVDVAVSGTMIHLGQVEVTTTLPPEIKRTSMAKTADQTDTAVTYTGTPKREGVAVLDTMYSLRQKEAAD